LLKSLLKHSRKAQKKAAEINGLTQGQGDGDTHGRVRKIKDLERSSVKRTAMTPEWAELFPNEREEPMANEIKPVGPDEAEQIAARIVGEYLNACRMTDRAQIGNYLMKLCSVAGVVMAQAEGSVTAFERMQGTAHFVLNNCPALPATLEKVQ
jgi:hypothetical protein